MGLFSRKDKAPKALSTNSAASATTGKPSISTTHSSTSIQSASSSLFSPRGFGRMSNGNSHAHAHPGGGGGVTSNPSQPPTPLTPFSPAGGAPAGAGVAMAPPPPKVDMPRPPDPQLDPAGYLRSLNAVRERSLIVTEKALRNELNHFDVDMSKFPDVVGFVSRIIKVSVVAVLNEMGRGGNTGLRV